MSEEKRKPRKKSRGNGCGTVYKRPGQSTWTCEVVVGKRHINGDPSMPTRPVRKTKGGFSTKKAALEYIPTLKMQADKRVQMTMEQVWFAWKEFYASRIGQSTMDNYYYAYQHFKPLHGTYMDMIKAEDLQRCLDNCPSGKRTHENMRCIAGLLWKYAIDKNIIDRNVTTNLYTGKGVSVQREALTDQEEAIIKEAIGRERYAEYVYCLCWLGYRPGEFLQLRKDQLFCAPVKTEEGVIQIWYFVNGIKTDSGRNRIVIVPDEILSIILDRTYVPGTDLMFPQYQFSRQKLPLFKGFKKMSDAYFRVEIFKPMMTRLEINGNRVPYSGRHSYADKLKKASGSDKDKAQLIGHSNYLTTVNKYQSSHLKDLYDLVNSFSTPIILPSQNAETVEK